VVTAVMGSVVTPVMAMPVAHMTRPGVSECVTSGLCLLERKRTERRTSDQPDDEHRHELPRPEPSEQDQRVRERKRKRAHHEANESESDHHPRARVDPLRWLRPVRIHVSPPWLW
jgi:hypothetical protein